MKRILYLLIMLAMISVAHAIVGPNPIVTVIFDEPVQQVSVQCTLTDLDQNEYDLPFLSAEEDRMTYRYRPNSLPNGQYSVYCRANDIYGNPGNLAVEFFTVQVPTLELNLLEPSMGVASGFNFPVVIESNRDAECRWTDQQGMIYEEIQKELVTSDLLLHTATFPFDTTYYVSCIDNFGAVWNDVGVFEIGVDRDAPVIVAVEADPSLVSDVPVTTLRVTTNELTRCKYDGLDGEGVFDGYNEKEYDLEHSVRITTPTEPGIYTYNVVCEDKAPWESEVQDIRIEVDLSGEMAIESNMKAYYSGTNVALNISTNREASCEYTDTPEDELSYLPFRIIGREFTKTLSLSKGEYEYVVKCGSTFGEDVATAVLRFVIDTTPPVMLYADDNNTEGDDPELTYLTDRLSVRWDAEDEESGIAFFEWQVMDISNRIVAAGNTTDLTPVLTGLNLTNGMRYHVRVKAHNGAGLASSTINTDGITVDITKKPGLCENGRLDAGEADVDCGGPCLPCSDGKTCAAGFDCLTNFCNAELGVCAKRPSGTCFDGLKNNAESDVDCGGVCNKCAEGGSCFNNEDCESGTCDLFTLKCDPVDHCLNGLFDSGVEADIDCGGVCNVRCEVGKSCNADADCISTALCIETSCVVCEVNDLDCDNVLNDVDEDIDNDGLLNWEDPDDDNDKACDTAESPLNTEISYDGMPDSVFCTGADSDDDNDGISDEQDLDSDNNLDNDGIINELDKDADGDNIDDFVDPDDDNDGVIDDIDPDDDNDGIPDIEEDTDSDRMPDGWENRHKLNYEDPADALVDSDGDELLNYEEYQEGTDPNKADTDDDGFSDRRELNAGTDPLDPLSHPTRIVMLLILVLALVIVLGGVGYFVYQKYYHVTPPKAPAGRPAVVPRVPTVPKRAPVAPPRRIVRPRIAPLKKRVPGVMPPPKKVEKEEYVSLKDLKAKKPVKKAVRAHPRRRRRVAKPKEEGWVPLGELKKAPKVIPLEQKKVADVFDKLSDISTAAKKTAARKEVKRVFKTEVTKDVFDRLASIAQKKKATKKDVAELLKGIAKASPKVKKEVVTHLAVQKKAAKKDIFAALEEVAGKKIITKKTKEDIFDKLGGI